MEKRKMRMGDIVEWNKSLEVALCYKEGVKLQYVTWVERQLVELKSLMELYNESLDCKEIKDYNIDASSVKTRGDIQVLKEKHEWAIGKIETVNAEEKEVTILSIADAAFEKALSFAMGD